jgi:hypothetical protein
MEGGRSEEGGKIVQQNVNRTEEINVVQKVLLARHQYTGPSGQPFPLICLYWSYNSSIVLPQPCSLAILSMMPRPWANLIPDIVVNVANKINDARDFIMFKVVCNGWNCAHSGEARQFEPWILKYESNGESGAVTFASVADMRLFEVSFPALAGKRTRLIGCGGYGSLVALDCRDWCNALMLNPLSPWKRICLPQLPKWSQMATLQACILCLEIATGAESFVVITFFWLVKYFAALESLPVSMWHLGSQSD